MNVFPKYISFLLQCFILYGCIDPLSQEFRQPPEILVIEGFIDDDFGPHEIEVSVISNFTSTSDGGGRIRLDAQVRIFDDLGNTFPLERETVIREDLYNPFPAGCSVAVGTFEVTTNYMTSPTFRGVPGRAYGLEVVLDNGSTYRSNLQKLLESPEIDSIIVEFDARPSENDIVPTTGIEVFVQWQDDPNETNFYFWDVDGTYRIETPDRTDGIICCLYDPRREDPKEGEACWIEEQNLPGIVRAFDDRLLEAGEAVQRIGFIEDNGRRFSSTVVTPDLLYHLEVHQYTMSEEAFNFYNKIDILSEIDGEIFDPPPIGARGNIVNVTDPNDLVAGFFGVFGKKSKGVFVPRSLFPEIRENTLCGDCRFFANGQLEVPEVYR